jgi:hypothetical protein
MRHNAPTVGSPSTSNAEPEAPPREPEFGPATANPPTQEIPCPAPHVVHYGGDGGLPISPVTGPSSDEVYRSELANHGGNLYYPFSCKLEWELAKWAKLHGHISASAVTDLLSIEGVRILLNSLTFRLRLLTLTAFVHSGRRSFGFDVIQKQC